MTIYSYSNPINTSVDAGHPGVIEPERAVEVVGKSQQCKCCAMFSLKPEGIVYHITTKTPYNDDIELLKPNQH